VFVRSTVCDMFPCLFSFFLEKLVIRRFSFFLLSPNPISSVNTVDLSHNSSCHKMAQLSRAGT